MSEEIYDVIIIGGGPGGITAGIYAKRGMLKTLLVEKEIVGGQIAVADIIENYPGFPSLSGAELMEKFEEHAKSVDLDIRIIPIEKITVEDNLKILHKSDGSVLKTKTVILCTGAHPKLLGVPGEKEFFGKGVSSCATCDGPFFRNQKVAVIGGGDTAVKDSIYLSRIAAEVHLFHRRDELRAEKILQDKFLNTKNIIPHWFDELQEVKGDKMGVTGITVKNKKTGEITNHDFHGVFIFIGILPATNLIDCEKDKGGFIITNQNMETSIPGVFAAGDCRTTPLFQVATAVGDGAVAAFKASEYIDENF